MKARVIAFYLPQFHPVEINDKYWGKGFTEWTNVAKAKPIFPKHYQPQIPADLGFYDLRIPEIRKAQAEMAESCGVEGFMYWNYWFGNGEKILEMPIEAIMKTGEPNFPFCVGWANHDWSNKTWEKSSYYKEDIIFLKQKYLGEADYTDYFNYLLPMFLDKRYITVDDKPLFYIYAPDKIPDISDFINLWNKLAKENGLKGIFFVARVEPCDKVKLRNGKEYLNNAKNRFDKYVKLGFDGINTHNFTRAEIIADGLVNKFWRALIRRITGYSPNLHDYKKVMDNFYIPEERLEYVFPQIVPRIDKTPRFGRNSLIYKNSTPEKFRVALNNALDMVKNKNTQYKIIFLNSWNEWGEGAYMEPDLKFGHQYMDVLREELENE